MLEVSEHSRPLADAPELSQVICSLPLSPQTEQELMRIQIVKWVSMIGLGFAVLFWNTVPSFQLALNLFICMAAAVVTLQAFQARKSALAGAVGVISLVFGAFAAAALADPEQPAVRLGGGLGPLLVVA